jgi:hypothetical protein
MNCETARTRILELHDPTRLPVGLRSHVDGCSACAAWYRLSAQIDSAIGAEVIPVNERAKADFIASFVQEEFIPPEPGVVMVAPRQRRRDRAPLYWSLTWASAAILLATVVYFVQQPKNQTIVAQLPSDPLLEQVVRAKVSVDTAKSTTERLQVLSRLADDLNDQARNLSAVAPGPEMTLLAQLYTQVIHEGLVSQARSLTAEERRTLLAAYADKLARTADEAEKLANEAPVGSDRPLREIAAAAREGRTELAILREKAL